MYSLHPIAKFDCLELIVSFTMFFFCFGFTSSILYGAFCFLNVLILKLVFKYSINSSSSILPIIKILTISLKKIRTGSTDFLRQRRRTATLMLNTTTMFISFSARKPKVCLRSFYSVTPTSASEYR